MSNGSSECEYELDPNDTKWKERDIDPLVCFSEDDLNESGVWSCPHNADSGEDLCIFHQPVEKKESDEVTQAVLEATSDSPAQVDQSGERQQTKFIGAKFGTLNLDGESINSNSTIDFRYAIFGGEISANNAVFDGPVDFGGSIFQSKTDFMKSSFKNNVCFKHSEFRERALFKFVSAEGHVDFTNVVFDDWVSFHRSVFEGSTDFTRSEFNYSESGNFNECMFECGLTFEYVSVEGVFGFEHSEFHSDVSFVGSTFHSAVAIMGMEIYGDLDLEYTEFKDHIEFTYEFPQIMQEFMEKEWSDLVGEVQISGEVTIGHRANYKYPKERHLFSHVTDNE
jgi:hypothetical protein